MPQAVFFIGLVHGESIRAQDEVDRLPFLCLLGALLYIAALEYAVKLKATIVVDRREDVEIGIASLAGVDVERGARRYDEAGSCSFNKGVGHD